MVHRTKKSLVLKIALVVLALTVIGVVCGILFWRPGVATHRFEPGQRLVYQLDLLTASSSNFDGLTDEADAAKDQGGTTAVHTKVAGELVATVLKSSDDGALVAFVLRKPTVRVAVDGQLAVAQGEA